MPLADAWTHTSIGGKNYRQAAIKTHTKKEVDAHKTEIKILRDVKLPGITAEYCTTEFSNGVTHALNVSRYCCSPLLLLHTAPPCCSPLLLSLTALPYYSPLLLLLTAPLYCSSLLLSLTAPPYCSPLLLLLTAPL